MTARAAVFMLDRLGGDFSNQFVGEFVYAHDAQVSHLGGTDAQGAVRRFLLYWAYVIVFAMVTGLVVNAIL